MLCKLLPDHPPTHANCRPRLDKRKAIQGIFLILDNGAKWTDLPCEFGTKSTVYRAIQHWVHMEAFEKLLVADQFPEFIKRLVHGTKCKIFLIVDGHPTPKAKKVRSFVESLNGQVSLHLLPGYSPELNPDEWVWRNLKSGVMGKLQHLTEQNMEMEAVSHLRRLRKQPNIVKSFFYSETTYYAA